MVLGSNPANIKDLAKGYRTDILWLNGFDDNYGYNLWRQYDKCTPIAEFAPQDAWMHPGKNFCTQYR